MDPYDDPSEPQLDDAMDQPDDVATNGVEYHPVELSLEDQQRVVE
jgi:hypothetical protein